MGVRRLVFPVLWLVIFAVIAAALFKLAFVDGMNADAASGSEMPSAQINTPLVPASLGTVDNLIQVQGSVVSDPAVTVRSTDEGIVDFLYVEAGDEVVKGDPLIQLKILVEPEASVEAPVVASEKPEEPEDTDERPAPPQEPVYTYADVVATADGTVGEISVLLKQQLSVGTEVAPLDPGTFSVSGTLTAEQQFRILGRTSTATVTVNGGPAPFTCSDVSMGKAPAAETGVVDPGQQPAGTAGAPAPAAGSVSCAVPGDIAVFAGLGASIDITAGRAENVVTIPTTAVRGTVQTGIVWVLPGSGTADGGAADIGEAREQEVSLGLSDGQMVEVTSGLAEGDMILQFVPGAPAEEQVPGMMSGSMGG